MNVFLLNVDLRTTEYMYVVFVVYTCTPTSTCTIYVCRCTYVSFTRPGKHVNSSSSACTEL